MSAPRLSNRHSARLAACAGLSVLLAYPLQVSAEPILPDIDACRDRWQSVAAERGIAENLRDTVIPGLQLLPRVLELDRKQPEFSSTFGDYLGRRVSDTRIENGRKMLDAHADLLARLTREYGVPGRYLVAFWGLETNYGGYLGNTSSLDALATLSCDPRRSQYFTGELMQALSLIERHDLDPQTMRGSWAGAMGHTQFMPTNYVRYGRDGDGDGRIDLWNSIPDALTSAAHFLSELGWEPGLRWGREVLLPDGFAYELAGRESRRSLTEWRKLGVRMANGARVPAGDIEAALIVPAGHRGPAFLAYRNFDIIMRWNRSEFYALSVGHLADRLIGATPLVRPPPQEARLPRDEIRRLQERLNALGFDAGKPDGIAGSGTRAAIRDYQRAHGLIADGYHSPELRRRLLAAPQDNN